MATIINTRIGTHRGKPRIWLEGRKLTREGIEVGSRFDVKVVKDELRLVLNPEGQFTVSRRTRNNNTLPIIDLTMSQVAELFDGVDEVRVSVHNKKIRISAHEQVDKIARREQRILDKVTNGDALAGFSIFHGGGVLDKAVHHGLASKGVDSKMSLVVELESKYIESSLRNNPELFSKSTTVVHSDMRKVNLEGMPETDIASFGVPCVGASRSGRSKNKIANAEEHELAGSLFYYTLKFVETLNPAVLILENVKEYATTTSMTIIRSVLGFAGYDLYETVANGNEFGALENRDRLVMVGVSKGLSQSFDLSGLAPVKVKEHSLNEVLEPLPLDSTRWKSYDYLKRKAIEDKAKGRGFARQMLTGEEGYCGTIGRGYNKARSTEPFIVHPTDPELSRLLTPTEHARVKGVPESVVAGISSETTAHEILGQSVICPVFQAVGAHIGKFLKSLVVQQDMLAA